MLEKFAFPKLRELNTEKFNRIPFSQQNVLFPSVKLFLGLGWQSFSVRGRKSVIEFKVSWLEIRACGNFVARSIFLYLLCFYSPLPPVPKYV
jgi:hypothetical protein